MIYNVLYLRKNNYDVHIIKWRCHRRGYYFMDR